MTRKDYISIARAFNLQRIVGAPNMTTAPSEFMRGANEQAENYFAAIADILASDNARFDRAKFIAACNGK